MLKCRIRQAHRDALFYDGSGRKGRRVPRPSAFGFGRRSAGGNGIAVTLGLPGSVFWGVVVSGLM